MFVYIYLKKPKGLQWKYDINNLTDSSKFWRTIKPIFSRKIKSRDNIIVVEGTKVTQEKGELAKTFNEFFVSTVKHLGINENLLLTSSSEIRNIESIIAKFENHPGICDYT